MRKKARTTHKKPTRTFEEAQMAIKEQPQPLTVRVGKRPIEKPIGDRHPNQIIRVSEHAGSPSCQRRTNRQ